MKCSLSQHPIAYIIKIDYDCLGSFQIHYKFNGQKSHLTPLTQTYQLLCRLSLSSRVATFTRARLFRSLNYPWGKSSLEELVIPLIGEESNPLPSPCIRGAHRARKELVQRITGVQKF